MTGKAIAEKKRGFLCKFRGSCAAAASADTGQYLQLIRVKGAVLPDVEVDRHHTTGIVHPAHIRAQLLFGAFAARTIPAAPGRAIRRQTKRGENVCLCAIVIPWMPVL